MNETIFKLISRLTDPAEVAAVNMAGWTLSLVQPIQTINFPKRGRRSRKNMPQKKKKRTVEEALALLECE